MHRREQTDDRQSENPYRAPGAGQGIAEPKWRRPLSMALYLSATVPGLHALMMTYWGTMNLIVESQRFPLSFPSRLVFALPVFFVAVISASGAAVLVWIARRISR